MTREEAINILSRLAGGATQPSWADIRQAAKFTLDELSKQETEGVTIEKTIGQIERDFGGSEHFFHGFEVDELDAPFLNSKEIGYGDKVIVQIRKK